VLTPEEGRVLASDIFNRELRKLGDSWTKLPLTLTLANIQNQSSDEPQPASGRDQETTPPPSGRAALLEDAKGLLKLRDDLAREEESLAQEWLSQARQRLQKEDDQ